MRLVRAVAFILVVGLLVGVPALRAQAPAAPAPSPLASPAAAPEDLPGQIGGADVCLEGTNGWENCCAGRLAWSSSEIRFQARTIPDIPACSGGFTIAMAEVREVQKNLVIRKNRGAFHIKAGKKNYNLAPIDRVGNFDTMATDELVTRLTNAAGKLGF